MNDAEFLDDLEARANAGTANWTAEEIDRIWGLAKFFKDKKRTNFTCFEMKNIVSNARFLVSRYVVKRLTS